MPYCDTTGRALFGKQLKREDVVTPVQYKAISTLIYDTDPYIYPALFDGDSNPRTAAEIVLPVVIERGDDELFRKDNLYIYCSGESLKGLILWHRGSLQWDSNRFFNTAQELGVVLIKENVLAVSGGYVDNKYNENENEESQSLSLINICVDSKSRGQGIGRRMMQEFIKEHSTESMELCVLADNLGAIHLYEKMGFRVVGEAPGFSLAKEKPICYDMKREPCQLLGD